MGILLNFQFIVVLNLFVALLWPATSPYMTPRTAEPSARFPAMNPLFMILVVLTALVVILNIVFLAGGHAH